MTNIITIILLTGVYLVGITTIFGSINPWAKKTGAGKIKQSILDWGYKRSIYWTNFVGLWLSGTLQCSPLVVVSPWMLLGGIGMSICYSLSYKLCNDSLGHFMVDILETDRFFTFQKEFRIDNVKEYLWGFCFGCLMLAAVIGG